MKLYLISGLKRLVRPPAKLKYANKPREKKSKEIQKLIYIMKPKRLRDIAIYNKKS